MNKVTSGNDYRHGPDIPHSNQYLYVQTSNIIRNLHAKKILDIGCGNGSLAEHLTGMGLEVVGIEPSKSGIENARLKLPQVKFYCMGVYDDPHKIEEIDFDVVISTEVVEHLFYPRELLRFAKAKLKPGGYLILSTPYHGYLKNLILSVMGKWDTHHTALWDGGHIKFWSKATLSRLLMDEGFEVKDFIGCGRFPYVWKSMLLSGQLKNEN